MCDEDSQKEKGNAAFKLGNYALALKHYNKAIKIAGSDAGAVLFSNKAAALLILAKHDACVQSCLKGLAAAGLTSELKTKLATALAAQEKVEEAMEALETCDFNPAIFQRYTDLLCKLSVRFPEAIRAFCKNHVKEARSSGIDTTALTLLMERLAMDNPGHILKQSRAELIAEHNKASAAYKELLLMMQRKELPARVDIVRGDSSGHVCTALLSDLKLISINSLRLQKVHVGKILICRTIAEPLPLLRTLVEDPDGHAARLVLAEWRSPGEDLNSVLPIGTYLAIKEPWYTITEAADDAPAIKVDNLADVIYLEQTHCLLKNLTWLTTEPAAPASASDNGSLESWESCQKRGNEHFKAGNYELAVAAYTDAIELKRQVAPKEVADLLSNRAAAYLADEKPTDAFWDCTSALFVQPDHLKATFRLAKAHANLSKYGEAKMVLVKSPHTTRPEYQAEISRLNRLLREQKHGEYDLKSLLNEAAASPAPRLDHADYNGGVKVQWISQQKGNGLVAQRDFAPGELLFAAKAFQVTYKSESAIASSCLNPVERALTDLSVNDCLSRIIRRISKNKELAKPDEGDVPALDPARIAAIISRNTIGSDLQNELRHKGDLPGFDAVRSGFTFGGSGVWILSSFMNHSCVPNTVLFYMGDLMFARAIKLIAKGVELTTSYTSSGMDYKQRQEVFVRNLGFKCDCELCVCDLKRARDQPYLEQHRAAALASFQSLLSRCASFTDGSSALAKVVEDILVLAEDFSKRLAYKDRYDAILLIIYKTLGLRYTAQREWPKAAKAFEVAYVAAVGNGAHSSDTFSFNSLSREVIYLCFNIAHCYLLSQEFAKGQEYLHKVQMAAKVAWGSGDKELLAMLYSELNVEALFKRLKFP